jgi:hypothetical protein
MHKPSLLPLQIERAVGENMPELTCLTSDFTELRKQGLPCQTGAIYKVFKYFSVSHKSIAIIFINPKGHVRKTSLLRVSSTSSLSLAKERATHFLFLRNHSLTLSQIPSQPHPQDSYPSIRLAQTAKWRQNVYHSMGAYVWKSRETGPFSSLIRLLVELESNLFAG